MVTVVIPTYNGASFIGEAVQSVFSQTVAPEEIIVVDDASTDMTPEIVENIARESPVPLRLIRLSKNSGGPAEPMNVGVDAARCPLIAILDHDDILLPEKLERETRVMQENDSLSMVFALAARSDAPESPILSAEFQQSLKQLGTERDGWSLVSGLRAAEFMIRNGCFVHGFPGFMFRRKDWLRKGGFDVRLRIAADMEFTAWLCSEGDVAFIPEVHYLRRVHATNLTKVVSVRQSNVLCINVDYLIKLAPRLAQTCDPSDLRQLLSTAAYWARESRWYWRAARLHAATVRYCGPEKGDIGNFLKLVGHCALLRGSSSEPK